MLIGVAWLAPRPAEATYIITVEEVGSDVVVTGSGTLLVGGLTPAPFGASVTGTGIRPAQGGVSIGTPPSDVAIFFANYSGPASFGSGGTALYDAFSGSNVIAAWVDDPLTDPPGPPAAGVWLSTSFTQAGPGAETSGTFFGESFASLGIDPGITATWTLTNGEQVVLNTVPEPGPAVLLSLGLAGLALLGRRRQAPRLAAARGPLVGVLGMALTLVAAGRPAQGVVIFEIFESGGSVAMTASGTLDLSGLSLGASNATPLSTGGVAPAAGALGITLSNVDVYFGGGLSLFPPFGSGSPASVLSGSGDPIGIEINPTPPFFPILAVPAGYVSGTPINSQATIGAPSLASLGLTPGTSYVTDWGSDRLELQVVPEPGTALLLGSCLVGLASRRRSRKRTTGNALLLCSVGAFVLVATAVPPPAGAAGIVNGGFETGDFTGWSTIGATSVVGAGYGAGPLDGASNALLETGFEKSSGSSSTGVTDADIELFLGLSPGALDTLALGDVTEGSAIKQSFSASAGEVIVFDFQILADDCAVGCPGSVEDFAFVTIVVDGVVDVLATTYDGTVALGSASPYAAESGILSFSHVLTTGGSVELGIAMLDESDIEFPSAILVDAVQVVPEPSTALLLASGLAGLVVQRRKRRQH